MQTQKICRYITQHDLIRPFLLWLFAAMQLWLFLTISYYLKRHVIWCVADPLWFVLLYILLKPGRRWIVGVLWGLWTVVLCISTLYFANFLDAPSLAVLINPQGLNSFAIQGALSTISWRELAIVICPVLFWVVSVGLKRKLPPASYSFRAKIWSIALTIAAFAVGQALCMVAFFRADHGRFFARNTEDLREFYFHPRHRYMQYIFDVGPLESYIVTAYTMLSPAKTLNADERNQISAYIESQGKYAPKQGKVMAKNVIFIVVESLNSLVLGKTIHGCEVTPTLNKLAADTASLVATGMRAQTGVGRSADGQFIYNTGLMPVTESVLNSPNPKVALPYAMANALGPEYVAEEFIGESAKLWNHSATNKLYGYNALSADLADNTDRDNIDAHILQKTLSGIKRLQQPFFAFVTTLQMHDDYTAAPGKRLLPDTPGVDSRDLVYFERTRAFDNALREFLDGLKDTGLYDNSVIVIASDHEARPRTLSPAFARDQRLLFMMTGVNKGLHTDIPISQTDVYPTILDAMGASSLAKWPGVGRNLYRRVANPKDTLSDDEATHLSRLIVDGNYFAN